MILVRGEFVGFGLFTWVTWVKAQVDASLVLSHGAPLILFSQSKQTTAGGTELVTGGATESDQLCVPAI